MDQRKNKNAKSSSIAEQISEEKCAITLEIQGSQQLSVCKEEWSPSLDQEEPEPPHIKEEQEELWTSQEGEQLPGLEEADIIKFTFNPIPVKSEDDDDEENRSSQLHPGQPEENRETEPLASTSAGQMETEADGEHSGGPTDPAGGPEPSGEGQLLSSDWSGTETDDSEDWKEIRRPQSGLNPQKSQKTQTAEGQVLSVSDTFRTSGELSNKVKSSQARLSFDCKVCGKPFPRRNSMMLHARHHSKDCGLCGKRLEPGESLKRHTDVHMTCDVCGKKYSCLRMLDIHMRVHTKQKPFSCPFCRNGFALNSSLNAHMKTHIREKTCYSL